MMINEWTNPGMYPNSVNNTFNKKSLEHNPLTRSTGKGGNIIAQIINSRVQHMRYIVVTLVVCSAFLYIEEWMYLHIK